MTRRRWGAAALIVGLGAISGCSSTDCGGGGLFGCGLLHRLTHRPRLVSDTACCDGPSLGDPGPCCGTPTCGSPGCGTPGFSTFVQPGVPAGAIPTMPPAGANLPPLAPAPRLVPQAQPIPAAPTGNVKAIAR